MIVHKSALSFLNIINAVYGCTSLGLNHAVREVQCLTLYSSLCSLPDIRFDQV